MYQGFTEHKAEAGAPRSRFLEPAPWVTAKVTNPTLMVSRTTEEAVSFTMTIIHPRASSKGLMLQILRVKDWSSS